MIDHYQQLRLPTQTPNGTNLPGNIIIVTVLHSIYMKQLVNILIVMYMHYAFSIELSDQLLRPSSHNPGPSSLFSCRDIYMDSLLLGEIN